MDFKETTAVIELVIYKDRNVTDELIGDFNGGVTSVTLMGENGDVLECKCMDSSVSSLILMNKLNEEEIELIKGINDTKFIYRLTDNADIQYDSLIQLDRNQENTYCVIELENVIYLYNNRLKKSINDESIRCLKSLKDYLGNHYPHYKIFERIS